MGLLGHLSTEDRELIEAGVHPVINSDYKVKEEPKKNKEEKKEKENEDH